MLVCMLNDFTNWQSFPLEIVKNYENELKHGTTTHSTFNQGTAGKS